MAEIWKAIPGSERHEASSFGRIRSIDVDCGYDKKGRKRGKKGRIHSVWKINTGYLTVVVKMNGVTKRHLVHRLVALAFLGEPARADMEVDHKNKNRTDNRPENLQYLDRNDHKAKDHPNKRTGGFTGARLNKSKSAYRYEFFYKGKYYTKSGFQSPAEAAQARLDRLAELNAEEFIPAVSA